MQRILVVIENEKKITVAHLGDILNAQSNFKRFYWIFHTTWFLHSISDIAGWEWFSVMFKEAMYIAEHIIDSSLFQAL